MNAQASRMMYMLLLLFFSLVCIVTAQCPPNLQSYYWDQTESCYTPIIPHATANKAEDVCRMGLGGHLLSVQNIYELKNVIYEINKHVVQLIEERNVWIGAVRNNTNSTEFIWRDGSPVTYSKWAQGEPKPAGQGNDCVSIDKMSGGYYTTRNCSLQIPAICKSPAKPKSYCPEGWTYLALTESCYQVIDGSTWEYNRLDCQQKMADLVSMHQEYENVWVQTLAQANMQVPDINMMMWTGLTYDSTGELIWSDGTHASYQSWVYEYPKRYKGDCVAMVTDFAMTDDEDRFLGSEWYNWPCNGTQRVAVCKRPAFQFPEN